jgi:hypothetical protein
MSREISAPKVDAEKLAHDLFEGIKPKLQKQDLSPIIAKMIIENIMTDYSRHGLNSDELLWYLAEESWHNYDALKGAWSDLTEEQRKEVIDLLISKIAEKGLADLLASTAGRFRTRWLGLYPSAEVRKRQKEEQDRILKAARDYLDGKISFFDMADEIVKVIWPEAEYYKELMKEEEEGIKDPYRYYKLLDKIGRTSFRILHDYFGGIALASYISDDRLKKLVQEYLINDISKVM